MSSQFPHKTFRVITHTTEDGEILYWGFGKLLPIANQNPKLFASRVEAELGIYEAEKKTRLKCEQREVTLEFICGKATE